LVVIDQTSRGTTWQLVPIDGTSPVASARLANHVAGLRLGATPHYLDAWQACSEGTRAYTARERAYIRAALRPGLGTPDDPTSEDHLQGLIAEHLWHLLQTEGPPDAPVQHLTVPKFHPTGPGPDGLVVFGDPELAFRLWEVKKSTGTSISSTVSSAYRQVNASGLEYLAQLTGIGQEVPNEALKAVFAQLPDLWLDGSDRANVGILIAASVRPTTCFTTLASSISNLRGPNAHRGVVISAGDFQGLALAVRTRLWAHLWS
jgi:hypothetical protein